MKAIRGIAVAIAGIAMVSASALTPHGAREPARAGTRVEGVVLDQRTNLPLAGVEVRRPIDWDKVPPELRS